MNDKAQRESSKTSRAKSAVDQLSGMVLGGWRGIMALALGCGLLVWVVDALLDYLVFYEGTGTFLTLLITHPPTHDLYIRLVILACFVAFGVVVSFHVSRRKRAEKETAHLNRLLKIIRNVNQLITHEKDRSRLLGKACQLLTGNHGFYNAWITLVESGKPVEPFFHAGFEDGFAAMAKHLRAGELPSCARTTLKASGVHVVDNPAIQCTDCPLAATYGSRAGLAIRLEHAGRMFGWLSMSVPREYAGDSEEHDLVAEVAGDIAFALWSLDTEERQQLAEKRYGAVLATTSDAVIGTDLTGRITLFNPGAEQLLGCPEEDALGSPISRFCPEDRRDEQVNLLQRVREKGSLRGIETERLAADGRRVAVEMTLNLRTDDQGRPVGFSSILRDITERKRAEEVLRKSEQHYRSLFDLLLYGGEVLDTAGKIIQCSVSTARLLGYEVSGLIGKHITDLLVPDSVEVFRQKFPLLLAGQSATAEVRMLCKDGKELDILRAASPILDDNGKVEAIVALNIDITELKRAQRTTARLLEQQTRVNELALAMGHLSRIDDIYATVCRRVSDLMDVTAFIVSLYDEEEELLHVTYAQFDGGPFDVSQLPPIPLEKKGHGTQSEVIHTGEPLYLPNFRKAREEGTIEYTVDDDGAVSEGAPPDEAKDIARSALLVPLKLEGKTIGVMQVQSYRLDAYSQEDIDLLAGLANVAAVAVWNAQLVEESEADAKVLQATLDGIIQALAATTETRDPYTAGHQQRVTRLVCAIAEEMGIPAEHREGIRVASLLHDIGKMSIPAEILSKPTQLTETEFALIKKHPAVAYDILRVIDFPWPVADIVLQHHERLDGSGYPNGLMGEEILLGARIICVADVVEAMSSHRPYRPAIGIDAALEEIKSKESIHYDSDVVDACIRLFGAGFSFSDGDAV